MDELKNTRRVTLKPGDRLLVQTKERLPQRAIEHIGGMVASAFGVGFRDVVVLDGDMDLTVMGLEDQRRVPDLLDANTRLHHRNVNLTCALISAAATFRLYADLHDAKGTMAGAEKAQANLNEAARLDAAMMDHGTPPKPTMAPVPVVEPVGELNGIQYGREVWPSDQLKEAGPVVAGGQSLVSAFLHVKGLDGDLSGPAGRKVLEDFVAFASDQLKAKVARGMAVQCEPGKGTGLKLVEDEDRA